MKCWGFFIVIFVDGKSWSIKQNRLDIVLRGDMSKYSSWHQHFMSLSLPACLLLAMVLLRWLKDSGSSCSPPEIQLLCWILVFDSVDQPRSQGFSLSNWEGWEVYNGKSWGRDCLWIFPAVLRRFPGLVLFSCICRNGYGLFKTSLEINQKKPKPVNHQNNLEV